MTLVLDKTKLHIYIEGRRRKSFVGILEYKANTKKYIFCYEKKYLRADNSIPLGPDIPLSKIRHEAEGKLFASFKDRIPSRRNPAYVDYCRQEGIEVTEKNPIILLGTIGKRGPSSFIFEAIYYDDFDVRKELQEFRKKTGLSLQDIAYAFNLNYVTVQRIESGKSKDANVMKLIRIYLEYPQCLKDQLKLTSCYLHQQAVQKLMDYIDEKSKRSK